MPLKLSIQNYTFSFIFFLLCLYFTVCKVFLGKHSLGFLQNAWHDRESNSRPELLFQSFTSTDKIHLFVREVSEWSFPVRVDFKPVKKTTDSKTWPTVGFIYFMFLITEPAGSRHRNTFFYYIIKNVNKQMFCSTKWLLKVYIWRTERKWSQMMPELSVVCHGVLSRSFYTVYVGPSCTSQHLQLNSLLGKMFGTYYVVTTVFCSLGPVPTTFT